jgi:hypothetical protein
MEYSKARGGKWTDVKQLKDGMKARILDECVRQESSFKDEDGNAKTENIAKVQFQGIAEPLNTRLNWTTIGGLIDAFGKESTEWIGHVLTVRIMRALVGGTMRSIVYLVPDGFELGENDEGRLEVRRADDVAREPAAASASSSGIDYPKDDINPDDIPF